jgi:hypothetical protein
LLILRSAIFFLFKRFRLGGLLSCSYASAGTMIREFLFWVGFG